MDDYDTVTIIGGKMRKKIFYFMHVDWDWIKQRPHFIAEALHSVYDVIVVYPYSRKRSMLTKNGQGDMAFAAFMPIPLRYKSRVVYEINKLWVTFFIRRLLNKINPDFIWITYPELLDYIPEFYQHKIIYDCMDDAQAFDHSNRHLNDRLLQLEKKLIQKAAFVFVSSKNLAAVINKRYYCNDKMMVIRNAFGGEILPEVQTVMINESKNLPPYKIGYIGTIASWFDFEAIYYCLEQIKEIEFHVIGPVEENSKKLAHPRLIFHGPVKHDELYLYVQGFECMIMPFKVNDLVRSVDPVKLYEYINYNKPIIAVYYSEIDRFSQYVNFYEDKEGLKKLLLTMVDSGFYKTYSDKQRITFLHDNGWQNRIKEMIRILECQ
jgi:hypothetical protein